MSELSAEEREDAFPIHIELGQKTKDLRMPMEASSDKKGKSKMVFPKVYIASVPGLEKLPAKGCMLVEFVRDELRIGKDGAGATLELHTICLMESEAEDDGDDLGDKLDDYLKDKKTD